MNITSRKWLAVVLITLTLILTILGINLYGKYQKNKVLSEKYDHAIKLLEDGNYYEAEDVLLDFYPKEYKNSESLHNYAYARLCYNSGRIDDAHYYMENCHITDDVSGSLKSEIHDFRIKVNGELDAYLARKEAEEKREYEKKISTGVPYVGMSESRIRDTSLGSPSSNVRHNSAVIGSEHKSANLYDFMNSSGMVIFSARCIDGKVVQVWDFRSSPHKPYSEGNNNHASETKSSKKKDDDPYNAKDYGDVDAFYDDYYDDFADFDEAEQYYEEHN